MQKYELLYILRPDISDEKADQLHEKVKKALTDKGAAIAQDVRVGKKELATPFKKMTSGYYYRLEYSAQPEALEDMQRLLTMTDTVIRFMNVKVEKILDKSKREPIAA